MNSKAHAWRVQQRRRNARPSGTGDFPGRKSTHRTLAEHAGHSSDRVFTALMAPRNRTNVLHTVHDNRKLGYDAGSARKCSGE